MRITARADCAMRAMLALAAQPSGEPVTAERLASSQSLPVKFVVNILVDLKRGGLVHNQRGRYGGYRLALPAEEISAADVVRLMDGSLADVRNARRGAPSYLDDLWVAVGTSVRAVLENASLADIAAGNLSDA